MEGDGFSVASCHPLCYCISSFFSVEDIFYDEVFFNVAIVSPWGDCICWIWPNVKSNKCNLPITLLQSCPATTRLVITLSVVPPDFFGRYGFFFFFYLVYIFWLQIALSFTAGLFYSVCTLPRCTFPLCLLYIYSYLFYCFMSENSSLELMFMFIQPTLSFLYALLVSRVGKYD